jgi:hypothetical protein
MLLIQHFPRLVLTFAFSVAAWLAVEQTALAQLVLAQTGAAKTAVGWTLVLLCLGLALLVVCRPSRRKPLDDKR